MYSLTGKSCSSLEISVSSSSSNAAAVAAAVTAGSGGDQKSLLKTRQGVLQQKRNVGLFFKVPESFKPGMAGLLGGSLATLLLHPLDLLKTRQAVHGNGENGEAKKRYARLSRAVTEILRNEGGVRGLYRGVAANVGVSGASWGVYFLSYGCIKSQLLDGDASVLSTTQQLGATFGAGAVTTLVSNPMSVVKTRMVMREKGGQSVRGAMAELLRKEGIRGMYKGLAPSLLNVSHGAVQFLAYEEIKKRIVQEDRKATTLETLAACSASKVLAAVLTYPCQTVRACQQAGAADSGGGGGVCSILRRQGLSGLYRGLTPYLLHVVPNVCLVFVVYETVVAGGK